MQTQTVSALGRDADRTQTAADDDSSRRDMRAPIRPLTPALARQHLSVNLDDAEAFNRYYTDALRTRTTAQLFPAGPRATDGMAAAVYHIAYAQALAGRLPRGFAPGWMGGTLAAMYAQARTDALAPA